MVYAYNNNGMTIRAVDAHSSSFSDDVLFADYVNPAQLTLAFSGYATAVSKAATAAALDALQQAITVAQLTSAILGTDGGWLRAQQVKIAALQLQL